jgi:hypothetical protein
LSGISFAVNGLYIFYEEKLMDRKIVRSVFGAALVLAALWAFAACKQPDSAEENLAGQIRITGIPATVKGKASYKVFVQLSKGISISAGYVAKGDALINGKDSVAMVLYDSKGAPWLGSGRINMAIVISPAKVDTWKDIDVYGGPTTFASENQSFAWGAKGLLHLGVESSPGKFFMEAQVKQLFDGGSSSAPGIICVSDSGIEYPQKP